MTATTATATTVAFQLKPGDLIVTCGGKANGRDFHRYRIEARVETTWAAPGARTLVHLKLDNGSVFKLRHDYPMQIVPAAEIEEAMVTSAERAKALNAKVDAIKDDPAFQARIAARRAARR